MHNKPPLLGRVGTSPSPQVIHLLTDMLAKGQFAQCEEQARAITTQFPEHAFAWSVLGACLAQMGRNSEAVAPMQKAISLQPSNAGLHNNLGTVLKNLRRLAEAEGCFRRALILDPRASAILNSLGVVLSDLGRPGEAEKYFRRALAIEPDNVGLLTNLASILTDQGRAQEAEECFRRAVTLRPDYGNAHNNLGNLFKRLHRLTEAESCLRRAVTLDPDLPEAHGNLGSVLIDMGRLDEAEVVLRHALALRPDDVGAHSNLLFALNCGVVASPVASEEAHRYGDSVRRLVTERYKAWSCELSPRRLRVGVVSGDLRDHVVARFLESLLRDIDPERIELIAYPTFLMDDELSRRLRAYFGAWRPIVGLTDAAAAARIHDDAVHILLDLSGHTEHNRLPVFAWKPAPVQATWLGYLATTGVNEVDYLIADPWTLPPEAETSFTEKIWRMPDTYLCFTPPDVDAQVSFLPALSNGQVTFGSFNSITKMTDEVVALWARVLVAVPGSRLYLKARQLNDATVQESAIDRYAAHGIGRDRLILEGPVPGRAEHLVTYNRVDIALDPFPYSGITTSAEALWMGVPVLTLAGDRFLSRQGVGLMMNTGLPEWVASDADDYVARAVSHAGDLNRLAALRASLRERFEASPICDAKRFARHFEQALEGMWQSRGLSSKLTGGPLRNL